MCVLLFLSVCACVYVPLSVYVCLSLSVSVRVRVESAFKETFQIPSSREDGGCKPSQPHRPGSVSVPPSSGGVGLGADYFPASVE